jgi:hypothetical protein
MFARRTLSAEEARQGLRDRPVLAVLLVSMILAALALGAVWLGIW